MQQICFSRRAAWFDHNYYCYHPQNQEPKNVLQMITDHQIFTSSSFVNNSLNNRHKECLGCLGKHFKGGKHPRECVCCNTPRKWKTNLSLSFLYKTSFWPYKQYFCKKKIKLSHLVRVHFKCSSQATCSSALLLDGMNFDSSIGLLCCL